MSSFTNSINAHGDVRDSSAGELYPFVIVRVGHQGRAYVQGPGVQSVIFATDAQAQAVAVLAKLAWASGHNYVDALGWLFEPPEFHTV